MHLRSLLARWRQTTLERFIGSARCRLGIFLLCGGCEQQRNRRESREKAPAQGGLDRIQSHERCLSLREGLRDQGAPRNIAGSCPRYSRERRASWQTRSAATSTRMMTADWRGDTLGFRLFFDAEPAIAPEIRYHPMTISFWSGPHNWPLGQRVSGRGPEEGAPSSISCSLLARNRSQGS